MPQRSFEIDELTRLPLQAMASVRNGVAHDGRGYDRSRDSQLASSLSASVSYRFTSLLFHQNLISQLHAGWFDQLVRELGAVDPDTRRRVLGPATQQLTYLLDDMVLLSVATCDYFAGFVGLLLGEPHHARLKFKALVAQVDKQDSPALRAIKSSGVRRFAEEENRAWVRELAEYRGDLTHYRASKPDGAVVRRWGRSELGSITLDVYAPRELGQLCVREPKHAGTDPAKVLIADAAEWLVERVHLFLARALVALWADIRHQLPRAPYPFGPSWVPYCP